MSIVDSPLAPVPAPARAPRGGHLVSTAGVVLPLRGCHLEVLARGGVARATLRQTFVNPHGEPLAVTYQVPLPEHAAVSGYAFELDGVRTVGRVEVREAARRAFEDAVLSGRTAALLEEDRSTLFEQELGNLPAGAEVTITLSIDQRLTWLAAGEWEWRFPTVVAPRYLGAPGQVADAHRIDVAVAQDGVGARASLALVVGDPRTGPATSPSHRLVTRDAGADLAIGFDDAEGARLDRDIVVRWPVAAALPGVTLRVERPGAEHARAASAFGLLTIVPPFAGAVRPVPRDLIVLLDTSGSMGGEPLAQAVAVVRGLVDSLGDDDRLELIEFSDAARPWRKGAVHATAAHRKAAVEWLSGLRASGSTEMRSGILAALAPLGAESQRQVLLVSDGLIGSEAELCTTLRDRLPAGCRVHVLGVGHAVNRTLTAAAARAGRGIERIVAPGEDPAASRDALLAATVAPLLVDLRVEGDALAGPIDPPRDLMGGVPTLIPLPLHATGGRLRLSGRTRAGAWSRELVLAPTPEPCGDGACAALYARERVTTLDTVGAQGHDRAGIDAELERLGLDFQIATPRTSWVATSVDVTVDPSAPTRRVRMPHELAAGLSAEGLGLRPVQSGVVVAKRAQASPTHELRRSKSEDREYASGVVASPKASPPAGAPTPRPAARHEADADMADEVHERGAAGIYDRISRSVRRLLGGSSARAPRPLTGRIVARRAGEFVIEVTLDGSGHWDLPGEAVLELLDGTLVHLTVDPTRSTAAVQRAMGAGVPAAGIVCRVTLLGVALTPTTEARTLTLLGEPHLLIDLQP